MINNKYLVERAEKNNLRTNVTAVLNILGTLFFHPSFFGLNQWFRAKNIGKTHQSRSQRSKRAFLEFSKKILKNHGFSVKKRKLLKNGQIIPKSSQTCSRDNLQLTSSYELIETRFLDFLAIFSQFSSFCFGPKSRCPRRANIYFLSQILVPQTQTYVWIP